MSAETGQFSDMVPSEPRRISVETREKLGKRGFVIYTLPEDTLENILGEDSTYWRDRFRIHGEDSAELMATTSYQGDVAVVPQRMREIPLRIVLFNPTDEKILRWANSVTERTARTSGRRFPGTTAMSGNAATFAALAKAHYDATRELLFKTQHISPLFKNTGLETADDYAVTTDRLSSGLVAVGFSHGREEGKLSMHFTQAVSPSSSFAVKHMPIIVAR
jgi:hypothetical protein